MKVIVFILMFCFALADLKINCGRPPDDPSFHTGGMFIRVSNVTTAYRMLYTTKLSTNGSSFTYTLPLMKQDYGLVTVKLFFIEHQQNRILPRKFAVTVENTYHEVTLEYYRQTKNLLFDITSSNKLTLVFTNMRGRALVSAIHIISKKPQKSELWTTNISMPRALDEVSCAFANSHLYVIGGGIGNIYAYDIITKFWRTLASRPMVGNHHAMEVYDDRIFVLGALGAGAGQVQQYQISSNEWSIGPSIPWNVDGSGTSTLLNNRIYFCGGIWGGTTVNNCGYLSMITQTWTSTTSMPMGRNHAAGGTDGSRFYIFGGRTGPNAVGNGFDNVQIYVPNSDTWLTNGISPMPLARGGMGRAVFIPNTNEFYIMGGETLNGNGATPNRVFARIDIYHTIMNTWKTSETNMPTPRHGIYPVGRSVSDDFEIMVAGGGTVAGFSQSSVFEVLRVNIGIS